MKTKLKNYTVICKLDSFGFYHCRAASKKQAEEMATAADRGGEIFFGEQEFSVVEVQEQGKHDKTGS